ncbi:hypothetical protein ACIHJG_34150 [Streptomyces sp. NPDC052415]|uniref:hypothetical protein n=1 Tax=Streptomyces sp. NPDC052415 TaxID=3365690 RepID=UPI0037CFBD72
MTYGVLYLYNPRSDQGEEEITVDRAPISSDVWRVGVGDGAGGEQGLMERPIDQFTACGEAIVALLTKP